MINVLPPKVKQAVIDFIKKARERMGIEKVRSMVSSDAEAVQSAGTEKGNLVETHIAMRAPNRPSLVLNERGDEWPVEVTTIQLNGRQVECIESEYMVILRSGNDELGEDALEQCEDFCGVVLDDNGRVVRVVGADGVGATQAPASTARIVVNAALREGASSKDSILNANTVAQASYDVAELISELNTMGNNPLGTLYRSRLKALTGKSGLGQIGGTTLLSASVNSNQLNIARLGDMGSGVIG